MQVLLKIALVTVLHNEVELVVVGDEGVDVFADVLVAKPAHQLLLLQRCLHRGRVLKGNLFHRVKVVVD